MYQETKKLCVTCFIVMFALLWWSRTKPAMSLRFVYMESNGEGNGTPLQCSFLENPRDGGAWWAVVYGVAQSRTRLSDFTFTFTLSI